MATEIIIGMSIRLSKEESEGLGFKIGRGILTTVDPVVLKKEIEEGAYDILRLRVDLENENSEAELLEMGYPIDKAGNIVKYRYDLKGDEKPAFIHPGTEFLVYEGSPGQEAALRNIVMKGCEADPIGYYRTPPLDDLIGKQREVEYMADYYAKTFLSEERQLWMLYLEGEPVAFLANTISGGVLDTPLAVVLPEYRDQKLLHEIMTSRNLYGLKHGLTAITNGARVDNHASNHVFDKFGMVREGVDQIYHVAPMLSAKR